MKDGLVATMGTQSENSLAFSAQEEAVPGSIESAPAAEAVAREVRGGVALTAAWRTLLVWCSVLVLVRFGPASLTRLYSSATGKVPPAHRFDTLNFQVDINAADAAELQTLEGIGPALAERIVQDRQRHGPFQSVTDLRRVAGFGEKRVEQLAPYMVFDRPP